MSSSEDSQHPETSLQIALSDRTMIGTLVGTSTAVLTFLLFFLYPRAVSGEIDPFLFQATLTVIVAAIFSFSISGLYRHLIVYSTEKSRRNARSRFQRAEIIFSLGFLLILLEPAFIFFTLKLTPVAWIALAFWIAYIGFYAIETWGSDEHETRRILAKRK